MPARATHLSSSMGSGSRGDTFIRNVEVLSEKFSVYAPDIIGHGFTDSVDYQGVAPQTRTARHLLRFAELLGLDRYSIGGSSFGGLICSLMWFAHPERIDTVTIIGAGSVFHRPEELRGDPQAGLRQCEQGAGQSDARDLPGTAGAHHAPERRGPRRHPADPAHVLRVARSVRRLQGHHRRHARRSSVARAPSRIIGWRG